MRKIHCKDESIFSIGDLKGATVIDISEPISKNHLAHLAIVDKLYVHKIKEFFAELRKLDNIVGNNVVKKLFTLN